MPTINSRNRLDKKDSLEQGNHAEDRFILTAVKDGWKIPSSTKEQNIDEHWDFLIEKENQIYKDKLTLLTIRDIEPIVFMKWKR